MRILAVDDSEDARDLTEAPLLSAGYTDVVTAKSAWDAFRLLDLGHTQGQQSAFDLMLLDVVMPDIDGIEACARVRNDPGHADLPIIMVTSLHDMSSLEKAFVAGANDYVTKPVNRIELAARVRAALKLKAELERRQARERELLSFLSSWGDRRATLWIDKATGLLVGEVAEAYLTAVPPHRNDDTVSVLALALDQFDAFREANGEAAANDALATVASAVRSISAPIGIIIGAYRNGPIVLVAPETGTDSARQIGESLCRSVARLRLNHSDSATNGHLTASVAAVTGRPHDEIARVQLLTRAISAVQDIPAGSGDRVLSVTI